MNSLTLNPPLVIITMGSPGSGKTFFSRQFSETHNLPCLSEDRIRFELFEHPQFNADEAEIIARILDYSAEQLMKTGASMVLDGDFSSKKTRERIAVLTKTYGYRTLVVWLQADLATAQARAFRRDRRNPDSKYNFNIDEPTFRRLTAQLIRPGEKEASVVISGKHAFKGQSLTVLRKIAEIYANGLKTGQNGSENATGTMRSSSNRPLVQ